MNRVLDDANARHIIINIIRTLAHTGVDHEGNLQACRPFTDDPLNRRVSCSPEEPHNWFSVVKDTRDVSNFAIFSQHCLEFQEQGFIRSCSDQCANSLTRLQQMVLFTRVLLDPLTLPDSEKTQNLPAKLSRAAGGMGSLSRGAKLQLGEVHLIVKKVGRVAKESLSLVFSRILFVESKGYCSNGESSQPTSR